MYIYTYIYIYILYIYIHKYIYIYYIKVIYIYIHYNYIYIIIYIHIINTYTPTFDGFSVSRQAWCQVSSAPVCPPIGPQRKCRCTTSSTLLWTTPQSRRRARGAWTPQPSGNPNLGSQKLMLNGVNNLKIYGVKCCLKWCEKWCEKLFSMVFNGFQMVLITWKCYGSIYFD